MRWVLIVGAVLVLVGALAPVLRRALRRRLGVKELARRLGVSEEELRAVRPVYREVRVAKRRGGTRRLAVPDPQTKRLQRAILRRVLAKLRAHPAATGFERKRSIVDNARAHVGRQVVVKLDLKDFFTTTSARRVEAYFRYVGWGREAAALLTALVTHEGGLPQGAPTSPRLSNLVNFGMDAALAEMARQKRCTYTRYADDMTFSMTYRRSKRPGSLVRGVIQAARRIVKRHGYELNGRKMVVLRRHQQQRVTGLVVNERVALARRTRRWLRAVEHRARTGKQTSLSDAQLQGWRALKRMVDQGGNGNRRQ